MTYRHPALIALVALALAFGCDDDPSDIDPADTTVTDAAPDGPPPADAAPDTDPIPDARPLDAAVDGSPIDAAPDAAIDAAVDAGPDAAADAAPPENCRPPCPTVPDCDGNLVCMDGECVAPLPLICRGACGRAACAEGRCAPADEAECGDPLAWALDVLAFQGETDALRSAIVGGINFAQDRVFCARSSQPTGAICVQGTDEQHVNCTTRNVSRATTEGELAMRTTDQEMCNEFNDLSTATITAERYRITRFGDQTPALELDGEAQRNTRLYYARSGTWSIDFDLLSVPELTERPIWARAGRSTIDAAGRFNGESYETFPEAGRRSTTGEATVEHPNGHQWRMTWTAEWRQPFEPPAESGFEPEPGCEGEPWSGQMELRVVPVDGEQTIYQLAFDGEGRCDGTAPLTVDGQPADPIPVP